MSPGRIESQLEDGETVRYDATVRGGGVVGLTDERLLLAREDGTTAVSLENVKEVTVESFDWFLGVMSVLLVGFGLYSTRFSVPGGLAFAAAGLASLWLTYRKRGEVRVTMHSRPKPLKFYLDATGAFEDAFEERIDAVERRREADR